MYAVNSNSPALGKSGLPGVGFLLYESWRVFRERWVILIGLGLLPVLLIILVAGGLATAFLSPMHGGGDLGAGLLLMVAGVFVMVLAMASSAAQTFVVGTEQHVAFGEAFRWGVSRVLPMIGLSLLLVAIALPVLLLFGVGSAAIFVFFLGSSIADLPRLVGGMILVGLVLTVLYVFLAVRLMFIHTLVALKESTVFGSFKSSWRLTKGRFWALLGRVSLAVALSACVSIVFNLLAAPLALTVVGNAGRVVAGILSSLVQLVFSVYLLTYLVLLFRWTQRAAGNAPVSPTADVTSPATP